MTQSWQDFAIVCEDNDQKGVYALWWSTPEEPDPTRSAALEQADAVMEALHGIETYLLCKLARQFGLAEVKPSTKRIALPDTDDALEVHLLTSDGLSVVLLADSQKGLRFLLHTDTPIQVREQFYGELFQLVEAERRELIENEMTLDAHMQGNNPLTWWHAVKGELHHQVASANPQDGIRLLMLTLEDEGAATQQTAVPPTRRSARPPIGMRAPVTAQSPPPPPAPSGNAVDLRAPTERRPREDMLGQRTGRPTHATNPRPDRSGIAVPPVQPKPEKSKFNWTWVAIAIAGGGALLLIVAVIGIAIFLALRIYSSSDDVAAVEADPPSQEVAQVVEVEPVKPPEPPPLGELMMSFNLQRDPAYLVPAPKQPVLIAGTREYANVVNYQEKSRQRRFPAEAVALSGAGNRLACRLPNLKTINVWDLDTGQQLYTKRFPDEPLTDFALDAQGEILIAMSSRLRAYNLALDNVLWQLSPLLRVRSFALVPNQGRLLVLSNNLLSDYDLATGKEIREQALDCRQPRLLTVAGGGSRFAFVADSDVVVWEDWQEINRFKCPVLVSLALSPDGRFMATATGGQAMTIWDVDTGSVLRAADYPSTITVVTFTPDGSLVVGGSKGVQRWRLPREW